MGQGYAGDYTLIPCPSRFGGTIMQNIIITKGGLTFFFVVAACVGVYFFIRENPEIVVTLRRFLESIYVLLPS